ncbi:MAG TPA: chemotaxis protein CheR [Cyanobacteria bacterium UBA8803]|nr:chemotaxis protein CheR [Cyanobacteria bacterium UBA9273]HBL58016.1 chemotaxis protein CheR [Cyanobacteria bacterium UBA8803]
MSAQIPFQKGSFCNSAEGTNKVNPEFEALLDYLKHSRGCDLTGYKHPTLMRRFAHQMQKLNIGSYEDYLRYLQSHPEECIALLDTILINVTTFFRDPEAWDYLANDIIPRIIASKQPDEGIRVWSAACASGPEVYSLIILFAEALGIESCLQRVQFYATDLDEAALGQARQAIYQPREVTEIPPHLLEKYFEQTEQGYVFNPQLRRSVIFGRHNLAEDAPISKIDLLTCRNALMYFNTDTQASIMIRFHFALKNNGFLFLGKAETLITKRQIFTPIHLKHRVYVKGLKLGVNEHLQISPRSRKKPAIDFLATSIRIWQTAFEISPFPQLAIDSHSCLVIANEQANALFGLTINDGGRPLRSLKPGQLLGLYKSIKQINSDQRPLTLKNVEWRTPADKTYFDISIAPVFSTDGHLLAINLTFTDVTGNKQLEERCEHTNLDLARVSKTLEETKATLDITQAELLSTQKELETVYQEIAFLGKS